MRKHELAKLEAISDKLPMIFIHPNGRMYEQADTGMGYEIMRGVEPANLANRLYRLKKALDEVIAHNVIDLTAEKPVEEEKPKPKATPAPKKEKPARGRAEAQGEESGDDVSFSCLPGTEAHRRMESEAKEYVVKDGTKGKKKVTCPPKGHAPGDKLTLGYCETKPCFKKGCEAWNNN
jgi:hypothetical protein